MKVCVITTGGTIAKTYNESSGALLNDRPVIESIVAGLRLPDLTLSYEHILSEDSLEMTSADRDRIVEVVRRVAQTVGAVVIAHGTDTLEATGERLVRELTDLSCPVVLTGAMRPFEFRDSDAAQNITEALFACRLVAPGVHVVMHNRVLSFPGVVKDRETLTFRKNR